jgi:uncharacterized protein (DUF302 family)
MDFKASDQVKETIGKRGLKVDDVMDVVKTAEGANKKIMDKSTGKIIAKKVIKSDSPGPCQF